MMFHERNAECLFVPQITVPHRRIDGARAVIRPGSGAFASKPLGDLRLSTVSSRGTRNDTNWDAPHLALPAACSGVSHPRTAVPGTKKAARGGSTQVCISAIPYLLYERLASIRGLLYRPYRPSTPAASLRL